MASIAKCSTLLECPLYLAQFLEILTNKAEICRCAKLFAIPTYGIMKIQVISSIAVQEGFQRKNFYVGELSF